MKVINGSPAFRPVSILQEFHFPFEIKGMQMGKETQIKEFTSPLGSQKEKLIRGFPLKFSDFLYLSTCEMVKKSGLFLSCCIIRFQISICPVLLQIQLLSKPESMNRPVLLIKGGQAWLYQTQCNPLHARSCILVLARGKKKNDDTNGVLFHKSNKQHAAKDIISTESR